MPATYDRAVSSISLNPKVEELKREAGPNSCGDLGISCGAISDNPNQPGRDQMAANAPLLARLQDSYGVPQEI